MGEGNGAVAFDAPCLQNWNVQVGRFRGISPAPAQTLRNSLMQNRLIPVLALSAAILTSAALVAGAQAQGASSLSAIQGDWPTESGSIFTISGTSGRLSKVSKADRASGYGSDEILIQGLKAAGGANLRDGARRESFSGTCRSPVAGKGKVQWLVSDCQVQVIIPADGAAGGLRLTSTNGSPLIGGRRSPAAAAPAPAATVDLAGAEPVVDSEVSTARRAMSPEDLAAQDAATARLNADVNARNAAAEARDKARAAEFQAAQAARDAEARANAAAYDREMAAYRARVQAVEAENARKKAEWEAAVAACKAGDVSKCASN
jgi:hypothetical protein